MRKPILLLLIMLIIGGKVVCQDAWIPQMVEYRDYLLQKNPAGANDLQQLLEKWDTLKVSEEEKMTFTLSVLKVSQIDHWSNQRIMKKATKDMPESNIVQQLTNEDLEIIKENADLLDLIHLGILAPKFPFIIDPQTNLFMELLEYDLSPSDKIGEIGAGSGTFSLMVNRIFPGLHIYINEVDKSSLQYTTTVLDRNAVMFETSHLTLVKGTKKSTHLEGLQLDKVIIRNSFHHFKEKTQMLASIKKSLKNGGELYLTESVKGNEKNEHICKLAMKKEALIAVIESNGFTLVKEIAISDHVLLKFMSKNQ